MTYAAFTSYTVGWMGEMIKISTSVTCEASVHIFKTAAWLQGWRIKILCFDNKALYPEM